MPMQPPGPPAAPDTTESRGQPDLFAIPESPGPETGAGEAPPLPPALSFGTMRNARNSEGDTERAEDWMNKAGTWCMMLA